MGVPFRIQTCLDAAGYQGIFSLKMPAELNTTKLRRLAGTAAIHLRRKRRRKTGMTQRHVQP